MSLFLQTNPSIREIAERVNQLMRGRSQTTGEVTLDTGSASTTVTDTNVHEESHVVLSPLTANAADEWVHMYISDRSAGSFTITHRNSATADRTYTYEVRG